MIARSQLKFPSALALALEDLLDSLNNASSLPALLAKAGVTEAQFRDPAFSYDGDQVLHLLRQFKNLPPGYLPVQTALQKWSWSSTGLLALAGMSSGTLRDAIEVALKFSHMCIPAVNLNFVEADDQAYMMLALNCDFEEMNSLVVELIICAIVRMGNEFLKDRPPCMVHFAHEPWGGLSEAEAVTAYTNFLNCPVKFNSSFSGVSGTVESLDYPLKNANEVTRAMVMDLLVEKEKASDLEKSFGERVRKVMENKAAEEALLSLNSLAEEFHVTPRTLIRKLAKENLKFKSMLKEVRFNRASHLITATDLPINLIAHRVGYQDGNAFIRAFKKQAGMTPRRWRLSQRI